MAKKTKSSNRGIDGRPIYVGKNSPHWKGGRTTTRNGYVLIRVGKGHHLAHCTGYAYEHRVVAETILGRRLKPSEHIHHKNKNRSDNNPINLEIFTSEAEHRVRHRGKFCCRKMPGEHNIQTSCLCGCKRKLYRFDKRGRPRFFISGHNRKNHAASDIIRNWKNKRLCL